MHIARSTLAPKRVRWVENRPTPLLSFQRTTSRSSFKHKTRHNFSQFDPATALSLYFRGLLRARFRVHWAMAGHDVDVGAIQLLKAVYRLHTLEASVTFIARVPCVCHPRYPCWLVDLRRLPSSPPSSSSKATVRSPMQFKSGRGSVGV